MIAHTSLIAVFCCSTRRVAELAWQVAPLCRQLGALIDRSTSPEDREEVLAELRQIDQECARLRAEIVRTARELQAEADELVKEIEG